MAYLVDASNMNCSFMNHACLQPIRGICDAANTYESQCYTRITPWSMSLSLNVYGMSTLRGQVYIDHREHACMSIYIHIHTHTVCMCYSVLYTYISVHIYIYTYIVLR